MALTWPKRHRDPLPTGIAVILAVLTTSGTATALAFSLAPMYGIAETERQRSTVRNDEIVAFAVPVVRETVRRAPRPPRRAERSDATGKPAAAIEQISSGEPTSDTLTVDRDTSRLPPRAAPPSPARAPSAPRAGPLLTSHAFSNAKSPGAAKRESVLAENLRRPNVKLNGWRLVSEHEKEGFKSEIESRYDTVRREHVTPDIAGKTGLVTITTGWLSKGPSREQRFRDSVIDHGNKERLVRLTVRAQAKRESVRVADSLRRLRKRDSL